jgi:hypothetical protein
VTLAIPNDHVANPISSLQHPNPKPNFKLNLKAILSAAMRRGLPLRGSIQTV